jgi:hypothetical protein
MIYGITAIATGIALDLLQYLFTLRNLWQKSIVCLAHVLTCSCEIT